MNFLKRIKSFLPRLFLTFGGFFLGTALLKFWFLYDMVGDSEKSFFHVFSLYWSVFFLDAFLFLMLCGVLWKTYQTILAVPLSKLSGIIQDVQVNQIDLISDYNENQSREIRELSRATKKMLQHIYSLIHQLHEVGQKILGASKTAFSTSKNQSALLSSQVIASNDMATAIRELVVTAQYISEDVNSVVDVANRTLEFAEQGQNSVMTVIQSMEDIRQSSQRSFDKITALGKQSAHITEVVKTIDRIIEDTKLIAFNATIEAARAKDEGKGFGVVALEIRRLAEEVFESTEDIKELIKEIQSASHALVLATEEEMKTVYRGALLAGQAGDSLKQILAMVKLTTDSAQRIASATQQQKGASEQVLQSVESANQSTRQFSQDSKQLAVTAAELNILADGLRKIIEGFGVQG